MKSIKQFVNKLEQRPNNNTVENPYLNTNNAHNLKKYLLAMNKNQGKRVLLIGEAPGFKGCQLTGIPFSSGKVFQTIDHPFIQQLRPKIKLDTIASENTASITWQYLQAKTAIPLFWNAFPFHPHDKGNTQTNRAPTSKEVVEGQEYLKAIYNLFKPQVIAGIGHKGTKAAQLAFPESDIIAIRHPSYGGKADFIAGLDQIIH